MKKKINLSLVITFSLLMIFTLSNATFAQTCINLAAPGTITENFDTLANTGTSNTTYPAGFAASDNDLDYRAGTGSSTTGDTYSFGDAASTERALGSLASGGTGTVTLGGCITNTSGNSFGSIVIAYTGEQWRSGSATSDSLNFEYSINATSITDGAATWTTVSALDFTAPQNTGGGALDGNLAANQANPNSTISVVVPSTGSFYFRWLDANVGGSDHGMGIDDFGLTALSPTSAPGTISGRARTANGSGVKHAVIMLTGGSLEEPIYVTTNQFGKYQFEDITVGESYVLQIMSSRVIFQNPSRIINLDDSISDEDFVTVDIGGDQTKRAEDTKGGVFKKGNSKRKQ